MTKHFELFNSSPGNIYQLKIFAAFRFVFCLQMCVTNTMTDQTQFFGVGGHMKVTKWSVIYISTGTEQKKPLLIFYAVFASRN
jgi:hypothetical protein